MSRGLLRIGALVILATVMTVTIAAGRQRAADAPPGADPGGRGVAVFNPVEGRIRVLSGRPEGARVENGEAVCELDPAGLRDRLDSQELAVRGLRAGVEGARLAREAAAMELNAYKVGRYVQEVQATTTAIKLAESNLVRHEDGLGWTQRMYEKGYASKAELVAEQLGFEKAKYALELAQTDRQVLTQHTREQATRSLMATIETARERELTKESDLKRAESTLKSLHDQIDACKVAAPVAGRVRYEAPIAPGAVVHDGQVLFRIIPDAGPAGAVK